MCMADLHHFTPDQHEAIAKVESLRAMRAIKVGYRNHFRSMPAVTAYTPSRPPRVEAVAAGSYISLENAA